MFLLVDWLVDFWPFWILFAKACPFLSFDNIGVKCVASSRTIAKLLIQERPEEF